MDALVNGLLWLGMFAIPMLIAVILRRLGRKFGLDDRYGAGDPARPGARLPKVGVSGPFWSPP